MNLKNKIKEKLSQEVFSVYGIVIMLAGVMIIFNSPLGFVLLAIGTVMGIFGN